VAGTLRVWRMMPEIQGFIGIQPMNGFVSRLQAYVYIKYQPSITKAIKSEYWHFKVQA
jgi:hypothetical protein